MRARLLSKMFEINYGALFRNLEGITHEDSLIAPKTGGNCINWVLGHIVATRNRLLPLVGEQPIWPREMAFRYSGREGADWARENALNLRDIETDLARSQQQLLTALDGMNEQTMSVLTNDGRPVADVVGFFQFHETYHAGQIALLRRVVGKPGAIRPPEPARVSQA